MRVKARFMVLLESHPRFVGGGGGNHDRSAYAGMSRIRSKGPQNDLCISAAFATPLADCFLLSAYRERRG